MGQGVVREPGNKIIGPTYGRVFCLHVLNGFVVYNRRLSIILCANGFLAAASWADWDIDRLSVSSWRDQCFGGAGTAKPRCFWYGSYGIVRSMC